MRRRAHRHSLVPCAALVLALAAELSACGGGDKTPSGGTSNGSGGAFVGVGGASSAGASGVAAAGAPMLGAGGAPPACKQTGEACTSPTECCDGTCNNTAGAPELNGCHPRCMMNTDCTTGCCVLYTGDTKGICADAKWCSCGATGARCSSSLPQCCTDQTCLAGDTQQTFYECKKLCTQASSASTECPTKCCVLIPNLNKYACLDPQFCPAP